MTRALVQHVDRVDLTFSPKPWAFADERREEIDAYFAELRRRKPALWNGRVLLLHRHEVRDGVFRGDFLETDFASFACWRDWGTPETGVRDCFGAGVVISSDGAVLLGVMGEHTASAGFIYFPCGTPDRSDVANGKVDLAFSVARELKEETGLDVAECTPAPGWTMITDGPRLVLVKSLYSPLDAETLRARVLAHLASEKQPELADIRIVRGPDDFDAAMPGFVTAYLAQFFAGGLATGSASA